MMGDGLPTDCPSCGGLNTSCPDGCGRNPLTGDLNGTRLVRRKKLIEAPNRERIEKFFAETRDERPFIDGDPNR